MGQVDYVAVARESLEWRVARARWHMERADTMALAAFIDYCDVLTGLYVEFIAQSIDVNWAWDETLADKLKRLRMELIKRLLFDAAALWLLSARKSLRLLLRAELMDQLRTQVERNLPVEEEWRRPWAEDDVALTKTFSKSPVLYQASLLKLLRSQLAHAVH